MSEYIELIFRCLLFYVLIVVALRIMGKREVGELSVLDMVIYFVMSEILAMGIADTQEALFKPIITILTLAALQILIAWSCLKKKKWRDFFEGKPVLLIERGVINQKEMGKQRYTIDDLLFQLRDKDISSPEEVDFAVLENNGVLTVLKKKSNKLVWPEPLIADGIIQSANLIKINKNEEWLIEELKIQDVKEVQQVFLCLYQKNSLYVILKQNFQSM